MKTSLLANCCMFKDKPILTQEGCIYDINKIKNIFINIHYWIKKPPSD